MWKQFVDMYEITKLGNACCLLIICELNCSVACIAPIPIVLYFSYIVELGILWCSS